MIWFFALICLIFMNYPLKLIIVSTVLIYALYTFSSFLFFLNVLSFLGEFKEERKFYMKKWYFILLMPIYNFITFWFRFAGIINSIKEDRSWKTRTLTQERMLVKETVKNDFQTVIGKINKIKRKISAE